MSKITIYSDACNKVEGFISMSEEFKRKLVINGKAKSTHENYLPQIARLSMAYGRAPLQQEVGQMEEYLYALILKGTDTLSSFKHLLVGDVDLDRLQVFVQQSKNKKDRYVAMSSMLPAYSPSGL